MEVRFAELRVLGYSFVLFCFFLEEQTIKTSNLEQ